MNAQENVDRTTKLRGQSIVELAIALPILLLLLVGMIQLGILLQAQITLTHATWEGSRTGATLDRDRGEGDSEIIGAIHDAAFGLDFDRIQIIIIPDESQRNRIEWPGPRGQSLRVETVYPITVNLPLPLCVSLQAEAASRIEYQNPP
jgi:hypothetical protein